MTADPAIRAGLDAAASAVIAALTSVQAAAGPEVAAHASEIMVRMATGFALENLGPEAARRILASTWRDLQVAIQTVNSGSGSIN